jgi:iron complex transport system permease protein
LAGPYVLGLSSGASLGVAAVILEPHFTAMANHYNAIFRNRIGFKPSFLVLMAVLAVSYRLRDTMAILIVGLMFGSLTSAIVGTLTYFSTAEQLQKFTFGPWESGVLDIHWDFIPLRTSGSILSLFSIKPLNALLLGENYARSLGLNYKEQGLSSFCYQCFGRSITAFAGLIAFIGLAVPHIAKLFFRPVTTLYLFWSTFCF